MWSGLFVGVVAGSLMTVGVGTANAPAAQTLQPPQKETQAAHPVSAVLRYGPDTMSACKGLSDNSAAICLLLALHVMQLSKKQVSETKL